MEKIILDNPKDWPKEVRVVLEKSHVDDSFWEGRHFFEGIFFFFTLITNYLSCSYNSIFIFQAYT